MTKVVASKMAHDAGYFSPVASSTEQSEALRIQQHARQAMALRKYVSDTKHPAESQMMGNIGEAMWRSQASQGSFGEDTPHNLVNMSVDEIGHRHY